APSISDDGRFVAFTSTAAHSSDIYLRDLQQGTLTKVSVAYDGGAADGSSHSPAISGDGRHVAFVSEATNLVRRRDRNRLPDVYVRDMATKHTELVSRTPSGEPGNGPSGHPALSGDGGIVVFQSEASDLICGVHCALPDRDINLVADVFRRDRAAGLTERVSRGRTLWMEPSIGPATDRTGAVIAFASRHPLDQADDGHDYDLFVWARERRR